MSCASAAWCSASPWASARISRCSLRTPISTFLGGVLLFLFGLYYRLVPAAGAMVLAILAKEPGWLHMIGGILMPTGVAIVITHGTGFVAIPILGSLVMLAATALIAVIVFRTAWA